jgi:hypothetical protein
LTRAGRLCAAVTDSLPPVGDGGPARATKKGLLPDHPLTATAARFDLFDVGAPPGSGWQPLASALDPAWTAARVDRLARGGEHGPRPRAAAGAFLAGDLAWVVAVPVTAAVLTERRCPDVAIGNVAIRVDDEGWSTRMALLAPRFAALPGDADAGSEDATVVDGLPGLVDHTAELLVATFTPVFASARRASPFGTSGMWGLLADHVSAVLWALRERGASPAELGQAWRDVEQLVDALQRQAPRLRARSRLFRFDGGGTVPPVELPMRGTCCLYDKAPESRAAGGDGLCTTCPRRPDGERIRLVDEHLRRQATAAAGAAASDPTPSTDPSAGPGDD